MASQAIYRLSRASPAVAGPQAHTQHWRLAEAKLLWQQKESAQAVATARTLIHDLRAGIGGEPSPLLCSALLSAGKWLAESRSASSTVVRREFLEQALTVHDYIALHCFFSFLLTPLLLRTSLRTNFANRQPRRTLRSLSMRTRSTTPLGRRSVP